MRDLAIDRSRGASPGNTRRPTAAGNRPAIRGARCCDGLVHRHASSGCAFCTHSDTAMKSASPRPYPPASRAPRRSEHPLRRSSAKLRPAPGIARHPHMKPMAAFSWLPDAAARPPRPRSAVLVDAPVLRASHVGGAAGRRSGGGWLFHRGRFLGFGHQLQRLAQALGLAPDDAHRRIEVEDHAQAQAAGDQLAVQQKIARIGQRDVADQRVGIVAAAQSCQALSTIRTGAPWRCRADCPRQPASRRGG